MKKLITIILGIFILSTLSGCMSFSDRAQSNLWINTTYAPAPYGLDTPSDNGDISGISFIWGSDMTYWGKWKSGLWSGKNDLIRLPEEERTGWGMKFDINFGETALPIGELYSWGFWAGFQADAIADGHINDVPIDKRNEVFGPVIAERILHLAPNWQTKSIWNPWVGRYWVRYQSPSWIPGFFFSVNTPWKSFYIGNGKDFEQSPLLWPENGEFGGNDSTWSNDNDREDARKSSTKSVFRLSPSSTIRGSW